MKIKQLHEYENGTAIEVAPVTIPDAVVNPDTQENLTDALERIEGSIPTSLSQLSGDSSHRLVTDAEKNTWNAKQSTISDLSTIRNGASKGATAVQPSSLAKVATSGSYNDLSNKPSIPSAVTESTVSGWGFTKNSGTVTGVIINGTLKTPVDGFSEVNLGTVITTHQDISGKQDKVLKFTDVSASSWVEDSTYATYPYRCDLACSGVTANHYAEVVFDVQQAVSGMYAPVCETKGNAVSIWSASRETITIPTILITK